MLCGSTTLQNAVDRLVRGVRRTVVAGPEVVLFSGRDQRIVGGGRVPPSLAVFGWASELIHRSAYSGEHEG